MKRPHVDSPRTAKLRSAQEGQPPNNFSVYVLSIYSLSSFFYHGSVHTALGHFICKQETDPGLVSFSRVAVSCAI